MNRRIGIVGGRVGEAFIKPHPAQRDRERREREREKGFGFPSFSCIVR